jgi:hypothetical protein
VTKGCSGLVILVEEMTRGSECSKAVAVVELIIAVFYRHPLVNVYPPTPYVELCRSLIRGSSYEG